MNRIHTTNHTRTAARTVSGICPALRSLSREALRVRAACPHDLAPIVSKLRSRVAHAEAVLDLSPRMATPELIEATERAAAVLRHVLTSGR